MDEITETSETIEDKVELSSKFNENADLNKNHNDNENSDDGCVDSEDEKKDEKSEVDVNDDRSQTPLQDEVESNLSEKLEGNFPDFQATQNENQEEKHSDKEESIDLNEEKTIKEGHEFKDLNDDHGELDYEEDVDDNKTNNKNSDENSDSGEIDSNSNKYIKDHGREANSSDGELLDDEDCEEGEIKEPGNRRFLQRPLCRFFTRGSCTWGVNCRFLHPGINDKGNYSMLQQHVMPYNHTATMPMPIRPPMHPTLYERLGTRVSSGLPVKEEAEAKALGTSESAWERGLRQAKELKNKTKSGSVNDNQKEATSSPVSSPSPTNHSKSHQLAPPPPRDPFYEEAQRPPIMPGMHHPMEQWKPMHEFEHPRWPRPHMHPQDFNPFFHYDYRMQGVHKGRRFSPNRMGSRFERFNSRGSGEVRGRPVEWKDPWSRNSKKKSTSRSGSGKRSNVSYSSFTSSSSSSSASRSSYSSSRSSSGSSSSRSTSSSPIRNRKSINATNPMPNNKKSEAAKVIPPSMHDLSNISPSHHKITKQKASLGKPATTKPPSPIKPPPQKPPVQPPAPPTPTISIPTPNPPQPTQTAPKPPMHITMTNKAPKIVSKHRSVVEAFKDDDDYDDARGSKKMRLSHFSSEDSNVFKSKTSISTSDVNKDASNAKRSMEDVPSNKEKRKRLPDKFDRSRNSSESQSSYSSSSSSSSGSSSSSSHHSKRMSHLASPISSDSSASPSKRKSKMDRLRLAKAPADLSEMAGRGGFERRKMMHGMMSDPHRHDFFEDRGRRNDYHQAEYKNVDLRGDGMDSRSHMQDNRGDVRGGRGMYHGDMYERGDLRGKEEDARGDYYNSRYDRGSKDRRMDSSMESSRGRIHPDSRAFNHARVPKDLQRKRGLSPSNKIASKGLDGGGSRGNKGGTVRHDRREELLMQLKAVEDAIAKKKNKNP